MPTSKRFISGSDVHYGRRRNQAVIMRRQFTRPPLSPAETDATSKKKDEISKFATNMIPRKSFF